MDLYEEARNQNQKLDSDQKLWFNTVGDIVQQGGHRPDWKHVKAKLDGRIPRDFDANTIPDALIHHPTSLTVLGHLALDGEETLLDDMEEVAFGVREALIAYCADASHSMGSLLEVDAEPMDDFVDLCFQRVDFVMDRLNSLGFHARIHQNQETDRIESIHMQNDDFDVFYSFDGGISEYVRNGIAEREEQPDNQGPEREVHTIFPIFRSHIEHVDRNKGFVLMPFGEDWSDDVYDVLGEILKGEGYTAERADDANGSFIMEDIWSKINMSKFIVAEVTGQNPNVMYELGIAHTVGKPVVMISRDMDRIPFDFRHLRVLDYSGVKGTDSLRERLPKFIQAAVDEQQQRRDEALGIDVIRHRSMPYIGARNW